MNSLAKKEKEKLWLSQFQQGSGIDLRVIEEREEPDFIVEINSARVGIEITSVCVRHDRNGSLKMAQESISQEILDRAHKHYKGSNAPPVHVTVSFSTHADLRRAARESIARKLSLYVQQQRLGLRERREVDPSFYEEDPLPPEVSFLHAIGVLQEVGTHWGVAGAGWMADLTPETLQERINRKAGNLPRYQKFVERNWLLLVSDSTYLSQMFQLPENFDASAVSSPFDRTFYLCYPDRIFLELGVDMR
ncbi:MAG: hypothetical protein ACE5EI_06445 [Thermodesulfobacteriota bacterium]